MLVCVPACETQVVVVRDGWAEKMDGLADAKPGEGGRAGGRDQRQVWTIELERFAGSDRLEKAQSMADRLTREAGLANVRIEDRAGFAVLSVGQVYDPATSMAQALLERVHAAELDGIRPYRSAQFRPTVAGGTQIYEPENLRQYPGMYTLQIAYYDDSYGGDFRSAAEDAVRVLREDGQDAYYYHGSSHSLVTVGLFDHGGAFVQADNPMAPGTLVDTYSPAVRDLQKKYPYNLHNSIRLIDEGDTRAGGQQGSSLVRVPR